MIVNIIGQRNEHDEWKINIPAIRLDSRQPYKIALRHLHYKLYNNATNQTIINNTLLSLATNLVDRSANNVVQSLSNFCYDGNTGLWQNVKYENPVFYPISLFEIENGSFEVIQLYKEETLRLSKLFIQLQIELDHEHGWI